MIIKEEEKKVKDAGRRKIIYATTCSTYILQTADAYIYICISIQILFVCGDYKVAVPRYHATYTFYRCSFLFLFICLSYETNRSLYGVYVMCNHHRIVILRMTATKLAIFFNSCFIFLNDMYLYRKQLGHIACTLHCSN